MKIVNPILLLLLLFVVVMVGGGCGSKFQLTALEVSPEVSLAGDTVTISATVVYSGDTSGDYEAELKVDGIVEQTQTFSFEPASSRCLSFNLANKEPGHYTVKIGDLEVSFTVLGVSNIQLSPNNVEVGQPVTVSADLQNVTDYDVNYSCCLFCQGAEVESRNIAVAAGSTSQVTFSLSQANPGWYNVELLGLSGTFKVLKPAEFVVFDFDVTPSPVKMGEVATITAGIENVGEVSGSYEVQLMVNGVVEQTKEITLAGGAKKTETFSLSKGTEGNYSLQVGDRQLELRVVQPVRLPTGTKIINKMRGGRSTLKITNNRDWDVVVILVQADELETPVWAAYVRSGSSRTFGGIAPGTYITYYAFGEDWDEEAKQFMTVYSYQRFAGEDVINQTPYSYTVWKITFGVEGGEGSPTLNLSEDEFPSLE
jgi:hypothetical protein